ncbi:helix-loop-helix protein delilah-like [Schistocerca serialis cubense]|uniref:helix-loop-helix protein delilah-like n=1 Tax=Schistocerca serialis cubense TaxID=2023355 RepID=UPI00214DFC2C|nr:helix-loop-helix protein delilah-like [Schistocerca serialis cubense]
MPPAATPRRMDDLLQVNTLPSLDSNNNAASSSGCSAGGAVGSETEDSKHSSQDSAGAAEPRGPDVVTIKYSLRPRSLQKRRLIVDDDDADDFGRSCSGDGSTDAASPAGGGGGRRAKRKPPPLSRYRRRTANARERERMREINAAFEALRRAVPPHAAAYRAEDAASGFYTGSDDGSEHQQRSGEKVTKIATLRLAMSYIAELTRSLEAVSASSPPASRHVGGACPSAWEEEWPRTLHPRHEAPEAAAAAAAARMRTAAHVRFPDSGC